MDRPLGRLSAATWTTALLLAALLAWVPVTLNSCTSAEPAVREAASLEEARALATETGGLIVVDFWVDG